MSMGNSRSKSDRWSEIRAEPHPKERYAHPFLAERAPKLDPGGGRKWAMGGLNGQWKGVLSACEEFGELKQRLQHWLDQQRA